MSRYPAGRPAGPGAPRPGGPAPSAPGLAPAVTIDPIKLFKKYKVLFVAAFVASLVIGVGAYFGLRKVMPRYTSNVIFEVYPPNPKVETIAQTSLDPDEIDRFMRTQAAVMTSDVVFTQVLNHGQLKAEAPTWYNAHLDKGALDRIKGIKTLQNSVKASIIPETYFIRLQVTSPVATDAAGLAKLTRIEFLNLRNRQTAADIGDRRQALTRRVDELGKEIQDLTARRQRIVRDENLETIQAGNTEASRKLGGVNEALLELSRSVKAVGVQLDRFEAMLTSPTGIQYTDTQRSAAEQNPDVANLRQQITAMEAQLLALQRDNIQPNHRSYRAIQAQIAGYNQKLADTREAKLRELFDAEVDGARRTMAQLRAQEDELMTERESIRVELINLTSILSEVTDLNSQINSLMAQRADAGAALDSLDTQANTARPVRIDVHQAETLPSSLSFPRVIIIVPLSVLLLCGLTGGGVVLRELLDQRVKSPADVAMIPRTKVIGVLPIASEDPSAPQRVERAFGDQPRGVLAESYRQLRTSLLKSMNRAGHRSLVVTSGLPGSGATTVVSNLAQACAATEQRVLIVDANFRRPAMHRVYALTDGPGLADVLAGETTLDQARQHTDDPNLDVLTAGAKALRVFERLGSEAMAALLTEAGEDYDLILIDVAPCVVAGDAMSLCNRADASMLVVRALNEKRGMVARLKNELSDSRAEFMGVLVNAVRSAAGGYMRKNIRTSHDYQQDPEIQPVAQGA